MIDPVRRRQIITHFWHFMKKESKELEDDWFSRYSGPSVKWVLENQAVTRSFVSQNVFSLTNRTICRWSAAFFNDVEGNDEAHLKSNGYACEQCQWYEEELCWCTKLGWSCCCELKSTITFNNFLSNFRIRCLKTSTVEVLISKVSSYGVEFLSIDGKLAHIAKQLASCFHCVHREKHAHSHEQEYRIAEKHNKHHFDAELTSAKIEYFVKYQKLF